MKAARNLDVAGALKTAHTLPEMANMMIKRLMPWERQLSDCSTRASVRLSQGSPQSSRLAPDDAHDIDDALRFRPREMRRLFEVGRTIGGDPSNWQKEPPRLEPLERIEARGGGVR